MNYRCAKNEDDRKSGDGGAGKRARNSRGGGAGMKKEVKALKCKGYFKTSCAPRNARSS